MKSLLTAIFLMLTFLNCISQYEEFLHTPEKYLQPEIDVITSKALSFGAPIWYVFSERDGIYLYDDLFFKNVIDTIGFFEVFGVSEETDEGIELINNPSGGEIFIENRLAEGAVRRGWAKKSDFILWPTVLSKNGLFLKVIVPNTIQTENVVENSEHKTIYVPEDEYRIFYVLKSKRNKLLISDQSDQIHLNLNPDDIYWVNTRDVHLLSNSLTYIPNWQDAQEDETWKVYKTEGAAKDKLDNRVLFTIDEKNNYHGFFDCENLDDVIKAKAVFNNQIETVYLNNSTKQYIQVALVDINGLNKFRDFAVLFADPYLLQNDLEDKLKDYFTGQYVNILKERERSLSELLEIVTGIDLGVEQIDKQELLRVAALSYSEFREIRSEFDKLLESTYQDWEKVEYYTLSSKWSRSYTWMPISWISPEILKQLTLFPIRPPMPPPQRYAYFDIYYIDGSKVMETGLSNFNKMYGNIRDELKTAISRREIEDGYDFYAYLSNSLYTVKSSHFIPASSTVDSILLGIRDGTFVPDRKNDRILIEDYLSVYKIDRITKELRVHFFIPERFLLEDQRERFAMISNMPELLYSLLSRKSTTTGNIFLHIYDVDDPEILEKALALLKNDFYSEFQKNVKIEFQIYNE